MMQGALYGGVNAAVLTPMRADLSVDLDRMAAHCRWLLANGCDGLGITGTTGEANSLGVDERIEIMEGLVERGIPAASLLPGTGTPAIPDTVKLTRRAAELGCKGALLLPPFFYKNPSDDGLFAYFSQVIERVGSGPSGKFAFYLYHFPAQSAVPFGFDLVGRLITAFPGTIRGVKDSSGDPANTFGYVEHFGAQGFEVYAGDDSLLLGLLKIGGAGCITAAANVGCSVSAEVAENWNNEQGEAAQQKLTAIRKAVTSVPLIPGLKSLIARHRNDETWRNIRPPHLPLTPAQRSQLVDAFSACNVRLGEPV
ncbi:MAG: dihydrodipicolinate synthase family protein [Proteobacteria bacterium]|nr:dihydrodipicolinate synthase family protein [Pseudomonadota bacterium]